MASLFDRGPTALEILTAKKEQVFADLQQQLRTAAASRSNAPVLAGGMTSLGSALGKALGNKLGGVSAEEAEADAQDKDTAQARLRLGKAIQGGTPALHTLIGEFAGENSPHTEEAIKYYNQLAAMEKTGQGSLAKPVTTNIRDDDAAQVAMDDFGLDASEGDVGRVAKLIKEYATVNQVPYEEARGAVMSNLPTKVVGGFLPFTELTRIDWGSIPTSASPASQGSQPMSQAQLNNITIEEVKQ